MMVAARTGIPTSWIAAAGIAAAGIAAGTVIPSARKTAEGLA
jgi:hypothetical protein